MKRSARPVCSKLSLVAAWALLCAVLAGCPKERPGAEKQIPPQRLPPALAVEPPPGVDGGAPQTAERASTRRP
jgi:hypothetical protein